uniref:Uncharacterized protein n=1 Tax=Arundo donax TaxID=35708 RepID=A0A0A9F6V9_ARUDO
MRQAKTLKICANHLGNLSPRDFSVAISIWIGGFLTL